MKIITRMDALYGRDVPVHPVELASTYDLHCHTCLSDADPDQTPERVCEAARDAGLGHLCITDHDHVLPEAYRQELAKTYGIDLISGCEFCATTNLNGRRTVVHIIGAWIPVDAPEVQKVLKINQSQDFEGYCKAILKKLCDLGVDLSGEGVDAGWEMLKADNPNSFHIARRAIGNLAVKTGHAESRDEFFDRYIGRFGERRAYVPTEDFFHYADIEDVMAAARLGLPTLCHLNYYLLPEELNHVLVKQFKDLGGEALEVDYSKYNRIQQAELYRDFCKPYGLLATAGSDRHTADKPFKHGDPVQFRKLRDRCRELHGKIIGGADGQT